MDEQTYKSIEMDGEEIKITFAPCGHEVYGVPTPGNTAKNTVIALQRLIGSAPGFFESYRVCHHSDGVCCRGFWEAHKDAFTLGQLAQRWDLVEFIEVDTMKEGEKGR